MDPRGGDIGVQSGGFGLAPGYLDLDHADDIVYEHRGFAGVAQHVGLTRVRIPATFTAS